MHHLPIFLDIYGKKIIVDGGGTSAARRVERALSAGGVVWVFDPDPQPELSAMFGHENLTHFARLPEADDYADCLIAYGASEDEARDEALHHAAKQAGALVNVADVKPLCDFITPSIVDRSPVTVAVSTSGAAPIVARILRARLEALLPSNYGRMAQFLSGFRGKIEAVVGEGRARRRFWEKMIDGAVADAVLAGDEGLARDLIDASLAQTQDDPGGVWLVGIGAGDPDLQTFRALGAMQRAEIVFHTDLAGSELLALTRRDAERRVFSTLDIGQVIKLAEDGDRVICLMPGDPVSDPVTSGLCAQIEAAGITAHVIPGVNPAAEAPQDAPHQMSLLPRKTL